MERYSVIHDKFPREFVLLQGTGCKWKQCTFCDYHHDIGENTFKVNLEVLRSVTGIYGVLDVINSGSAMELDADTLQLIKTVVLEKHIHILWFEMHYMYRHKLDDFARYFAPVTVKFRCGVESFDPLLRKEWNKGISENVMPADVARYFQGVCLLCCTEGDSKDRILSDIRTAKRYFEYLSVNVFCNNTSKVRQDVELAKWFESEVYPKLQNDAQVEVLLNNTDLGVG